MTVVYILIGLMVLVASYVVLTYNGLVSLKNRVGEAWSDIEVQMKVRCNLIPSVGGRWRRDAPPPLAF